MKQLIVTVLTTGGIALGAVGYGLAASPSQQSCEDSGGTFSRVNGDVQCTTHVGNSDNSQTVDTGGKGNLQNKETCSGPGNSTAKCP